MIATVESLKRPPLASAPAAESVKPIYFVIRQNKMPWSVGAEIIGVAHTLILAEDMAVKEKTRAPGFHIGVTKLMSEARTVAKPVEITRLQEGDRQ